MAIVAITIAVTMATTKKRFSSTISYKLNVNSYLKELGNNVAERHFVLGQF